MMIEEKIAGGFYAESESAIVGPTAGQDQPGYRNRQETDGEIVSGGLHACRSTKEVAIGTAKASQGRAGRSQPLPGGCPPVFEDFSVKNFVDEARSAIGEIAGKGKLPIIAGGTGFYVNALLNDMQLGDKEEEAASVDPEWEVFLADNGPQALWEELNKKDPEAAKKIPVANSRRSLRALSVISRTGGLFQAAGRN